MAMLFYLILTVSFYWLTDKAVINMILVDPSLLSGMSGHIYLVSTDVTDNYNHRVYTVLLYLLYIK